MSGNKLLAENTIRRFMKLASVDTMTDNFISEMGMKYKKDEIDEEVNEDDTIIENKGASLLIDPLSYQYLVGSKIDYVEGLEGSRFIVNNPMATTTCGCGSSFSI